jgi:hypothetical protein
VWRWFYMNVVCRYGVPYVVRTDSGTEYKGAFQEGYRDWGIMHRFVSVQYP